MTLDEKMSLLVLLLYLLIFAWASITPEVDLSVKIAWVFVIVLFVYNCIDSLRDKTIEISPDFEA